ncbi:MAG: DUF1700 domain-containing protein [Lachnospiraceae bacterium]|nr:DUF1700 domain-containing protein [Lachnospiraceae bacterium]
MNKSEFLKALTKQLKYLPKEDREDAISYYTEYFEDSGIDENEDVSLRFGDPKKLAGEIINATTMKHIYDNEAKRSPKKTAKIIWISIISILSLPISLPIAICLLIVVLTLFITLFAVFLAFLWSAIAIMAAGVGIFIAGFFVAGIGQKLVCFGIGLIVFAVGMAICFLTILVFVLIVRLIVHIIKKTASKRQKKE